MSLTSPVLQEVDDEQPIVPSTATLSEYQIVESRTNRAERSGILEVYRDEAAMERANTAHKSLVNIVAERVRHAGSIPKKNKFIDLAANISEDYIFEMKSTTSLNGQSQIRKGISQLYEYRYLQGNEDANLVLVIENSLDNNDKWLLDYLEIDREILLVWDGDGVNLYGSENARVALPFLELRRPR